MVAGPKGAAIVIGFEMVSGVVSVLEPGLTNIFPPLDTAVTPSAKVG